MPPLLDLSNELLYKIIDHVHPDDIINFSVTCKDVYRLAKDAVSLHLRQKKHYTEVVLDGCHRHENNAHPLQMLKELCMDWKRGEYVKELEFKCCERPPNPDLYPEEEDVEDSRRYEVEKRKDMVMTRTVMQDIWDYIYDKFDESGFSYPTMFDIDSLCYEAERGERSATLVLLLLFIPNLEVLRLRRFTQATMPVIDAIFTMTGENVQRSLEARKPLMNLHTIKLLGPDGEDGADNFEVLIWFAALPSMRTLVGQSLVGNPEEPVAKWTLPLHSSNVTAVILHESWIEIEVLEQLLAGIRSLKAFAYFHNQASGARIEGHKLLALLHENTKKSLGYLSVLGPCRLSESQHGNDTIGRCLQDFDVLTELHLSFEIYIEIRPWYGTPEGRTRREDVQPLVYTLPPSVKEFSLDGIAKFHRVAALFVDFAEQKALRLPHLRHICIYRHEENRDDESVQAGQGGWRELKEVCEKVGVVLGEDHNEE